MIVSVLGSGSEGNATVVEAEGAAVLIDAGFSGRDLEQRLNAMQRRPAAGRHAEPDVRVAVSPVLRQSIGDPLRQGEPDLVRQGSGDEHPPDQVRGQVFHHRPEIASLARWRALVVP